MRAKYFLLVSLSFMILLFSIYMALFYFQLGTPVKAEWWVKECYQYKDYRAESIHSKKVIIISGSNALFAINSNLLEKKLGYPVVNLATHMYLDIDYLYYELEKNIGKGDIVIMPLEFEYYSRTDKLSTWFTNNIMSWGRSYLKQLDLISFGKFVLNTEPSRVFRATIEQVLSKGVNNKLATQKAEVDRLEYLWAKEGVRWRGYSYESLNKFGDFEVDKPVKYTAKKNNYFDDEIHISSHFVNKYKQIEKLVKEHNGTLYLTYPVTKRNKLFNFNDLESQKHVEHLESLLKAKGITLQCNAALFDLDNVYFFNNVYHPNKYGALINSENLAFCIDRLIQNPHSAKLSYKDAMHRTLSLEEKYINDVEKLENNPH